ncbi:hypothetical protein V3W47_11800 [Deinococcus sp. YIM 134068]|uniref:hypothetical protein n=1 Tax=Deinococcus lichenicola TaxID=3118910 RepID=UPI002F930852
MKKALLGLLALSAVSSAAADSVGGSIGTGLTVHYQTDLTSTSSIRYGLNLDALNLFRGGSLAIGGDVAYLGELNGSQALGPFDPYYGLGLGAYVSLGSSSGLVVYPNGILGLNFQVTTPLSVFVEGSAGPRIVVGTGSTGIDFGFGARVGVNYQFR